MGNCSGSGEAPARSSPELVAREHAPRKPTAEEILARYDVHAERLGSGATSDVFVGTVRADGTRVAVKVLDKLTTDPGRRENLHEDIEGARVEAELMRELNGHKHVAELHDFVESSSKLSTFLELVPGGELYDQLKLSAYTEAEAREHFRQMMEGISHIHKAHIVHRDIKPDNILMTEPTRTATLKIVDFGFAARVPPGSQLFERLGTPKYVAPEVWAADEGFGRGYSEQADMYAFGIILHQMLTGQEPFDYYRDAWAEAHPPEGGMGMDDERTHEFAQFTALHPIKALTDTISPGESMLSKEAIDLISSLLSRDPGSRCTAEEALAHPWFKAETSGVKLEKASEGIRAYQAQVRLRKAMKAVLFTARIKGLTSKLRKPARAAASSSSSASEDE